MDSPASDPKADSGEQVLLAKAAGAETGNLSPTRLIKVPSAKMQREVEVTVTLPRSYRETDLSCPVVYLLHGAGGNGSDWAKRTPVQDLADSYGIIVVSPWVGGSWYLDSPEVLGSQFETFVSSELIAYIDSHFRTRANRDGRGIACASMGGHGAMFLAARHKDVFGAAASMSGCMDLLGSDPQVGAFANDWGLVALLGSPETQRERWKSSSSLQAVESLNSDELAISFECGTSDFFLKTNQALDAKLTAKGIPHSYAEYAGSHHWDYWNAALPRQMAFMNRHFMKALAPAPVSGPLVGRHAEKVAAVKAQQYDLLLIGDSITHTLNEYGGKYAPLSAVWDKHYAPRRALNLGFSGYRLENLLWNLQNRELEGQTPKVAVLLVGTNNADSQHFSAGLSSPEEICGGTQAIVETIQKRFPSTKILLLRIFPKGGKDEQGTSDPVFHFSPQEIETARRAGELTAQLADGKRVFWLDVGDIFLLPNGKIDTRLMPDLLHPNAAGAEAWARAMEPMLSQLMGDKPIQ